MSEWIKVGDKVPDKSLSLEVVGYWTYCCESDADHEISIRKAIFNDNDVYESDNGYFILPLFWRYLGND